MEALSPVIVQILFGIACAAIADTRGRNAVAWFFIGLFFNCFALVVLLVLPDLREQETRAATLRAENRRLRERLTAERQVGEQRHAQVSHRLDAHDRALGMDTHALAAAARPELDAPGHEELAGRQWHLIHDGRQEGPVPFSELQARWQQGEIDADTWLWSEGMVDWQHLRDVPGLPETMKNA